MCGDILQPGGKLETSGLVETQMFKKCWKPGTNALYLYVSETLGRILWNKHSHK